MPEGSSEPGRKALELAGRTATQRDWLEPPFLKLQVLGLYPLLTVHLLPPLQRAGDIKSRGVQICFSVSKSKIGLVGTCAHCLQCQAAWREAVYTSVRSHPFKCMSCQWSSLICLAADRYVPFHEFVNDHPFVFPVLKYFTDI